MRSFTPLPNCLNFSSISSPRKSVITHLSAFRRSIISNAFSSEPSGKRLDIRPPRSTSPSASSAAPGIAGAGATVRSYHRQLPVVQKVDVHPDLRIAAGQAGEHADPPGGHVLRRASSTLTWGVASMATPLPGPLQSMMAEATSSPGGPPSSLRPCAARAPGAPAQALSPGCRALAGGQGGMHEAHRAGAVDDHAVPGREGGGILTVDTTGQGLEARPVPGRGPGKEKFTPPRRTVSAGTAMNSANPPSWLKPMMPWRSQRLSRPLRHGVQVPQAMPGHIWTRSPSPSRGSSEP